MKKFNVNLGGAWFRIEADGRDIEAYPINSKGNTKFCGLNICWCKEPFTSPQLGYSVTIDEVRLTLDARKFIHYVEIEINNKHIGRFPTYASVKISDYFDNWKLKLEDGVLYFEIKEPYEDVFNELQDELEQEASS